MLSLGVVQQTQQSANAVAGRIRTGHVLVTGCLHCVDKRYSCYTPMCVPSGAMYILANVR